MKTLKTFHFDPTKSGRILNDWAKEAGVSTKALGDDTGYTYDTANNSLHGKIKELSLERVFKFSVRTGHSVCEFIRLMLQDEEIDFRDQIHVLKEADFVLVPYEETIVQTAGKERDLVQPSVQGTAIDHNDPVYQAVYAAMMQQAANTHQANLDRFRAIHEGYVKMLEDAHKKSIEDQEKAHQEHIDTVRKVARQRLRWIVILAVILAAIVAWFIWDLTHPEIGLIRLKQAGYIGKLLGLR